MLQQKKSTQNNTIVCSNLKTFNEKEYSEDYISKAFKNCSDKKYSIVRYRKFLSGISGKLIPRDVIDTIRFNTGFSIGERSEEHTSELQSRPHLVCRLLLEKK